MSLPPDAVIVWGGGPLLPERASGEHSCVRLNRLFSGDELPARLPRPSDARRTARCQRARRAYDLRRAAERAQIRAENRRPCLCGCGELITPRTGEHRYVNPTHRNRHHRRIEREAQRAVVAQHRARRRAVLRGEAA